MNHRSIASLLIFAALLACEPAALFSAATPTRPPDLIATDVARQRAVAATLTAEAPKPTPQPPPPTTPAPPPAPTFTPTATITATPMKPTVTPTLPPNRIRNLQPMEVPYQGARRLQLVAEYFYNGEWGADKIYLVATAWNDQAQILEIYSDRKPITPGEGVVTMELILHDRGTYITSRIQLCMFAEGSVPRVHCQFWPYAKTWKM